jgi:hypothetical protein
MPPIKEVVDQCFGVGAGAGDGLTVVLGATVVVGGFSLDVVLL